MFRFIFTALSFLHPLTAADKWEEVRSGPFEIYTNGAEKETRQLLVRLEQVRHVMSTMLGKQDLVSLWPIRIVLDKTKGVKAAPWALGRDAWISQLAASGAITPAWQREVARMLLESNARRMPPAWENGILDLLSTLDAAGPKVTLGAPPTTRNPDWARVQYLATDALRAGRLRVLLNNLQNGGDEDVAYRNAFPETKTAIEGEVAAYFKAGQFAPVTISGRAMSERDSIFKPLELPRVNATLADLTNNPKLPAAGTMEAAEGLGLAAAAAGDKTQTAEWLKQAIAAGSKSARVHLEYGRALDEPKAKQDAYVEAAKKNGRWAQPYIELANLETTPSRQAFYLKTAASLDPRNSALWQRLAKAQLEAKEFADASRSWYAAELAAPTPAGRAEIARARRQFEQDRAEREDSERRRIADEKQRELDRLRTEAMNRIKEAESKANKGATPVDESKVVAWWDDKTPSLKLSGTLQKVDCIGSAARLWIAPSSGKAQALLIKDPSQVVITGGGEGGRAAFGCGVQKPQRQVNVEYKARVDAKLGTIGDVAMLEFR